jgi:hypothetical protein
MRLGYRLLKQPSFRAIQSLTHEEFLSLQQECEFNRVEPKWKRLGKRLLQAKTVRAVLVPKPA